MSDVASVEHGDFTVTSTDTTAEAMKADLDQNSPEPESQEPDPSKAAAVLGKKGGEAAAAKRAKEAKEAKREAKRGANDAEVDGVSDADEAGEDTGGEGVDEKPPTEKPLGKPRDDPRARMLEATRKEAEAKRERDAERQRREAAERRLEALERERQAPPPPPDAPKRPEGKPKADDYESWEDFLEARLAYDRQEHERELAMRYQQSAREQQVNEYVSRFSAKVTEAAKADPDFYRKVSPEIMNLRPRLYLSPEERPYANAGNWIADELVDNVDDAPALMLHLSEHPDDFQRIAALSNARAVAREMAKLVTRLDVATTELDSRPAVSKARPPVKSVNGAPQVAEGYREDMSLDEFVRMENARSRRR